MKLTQATPAMAALCFQHLKRYLDGQPDDLAGARGPDDMHVVDGMFITWETVSGELRGCIGSLREMPVSGLQQYAITSSQHDTRFSPIRLTDIHLLQCKVSILHTMEPCLDSLDWTIGVHGIIVEFIRNDKSYKATFLPSVMVEQKWSKEVTLRQACTKSGYRGSFKKVADILSVTRYQASVASITYSEYASGYI